MRIFVGLCFCLGVSFISKYKGSLVLNYKAIPAVFLVGCLAQAIPFLLLFQAETVVSAGLAGILNGTVPLWTVVLSMIFFSKLEVIDRRKIIGLLIGFVGLILVCLPSFQFEGGQLKAQLIAIGFLLGMALSYSLGALGAKVLRNRYEISALGAAFYYHLASFIFLMVYKIIFQGTILFDVSQASYASLAALGYLGVFSNGIAFLIFYYLITEWGPTRATTVTYLVPAISVMFDFLFFKTIPSPLHIIGMVIVLFSIIFMNQSIPSKTKPVSL
jgi:drug/metabolite transporter (DMT)-like permease